MLSRSAVCKWNASEQSTERNTLKRCKNASVHFYMHIMRMQVSAPTYTQIHTHSTSVVACSSNVSFISVLILLQVTETRTGPLGCSSYDNLDSVSSILLQSPESKLHLQGKQTQHINISICPVMLDITGQQDQSPFWPLKLKEIYSHALRWTREMLYAFSRIECQCIF